MDESNNLDNICDSIQESDSIEAVKNHLSVSKYCLFRAFTFASTVKEIYVFSIRKENIITGLVFEKIDQSKAIWQIQDIKFKSIKFLSYSNPPIDISSIFIKYGWDRKIHFGWDEGEDAEMLYPVYSISQLPLPNQVQTDLTSLLEELGNKLQDWNNDSTIMEIIDPDLNPNYFITKPPKSATKKPDGMEFLQESYFLKLIQSNKAPLNQISNKIKSFSWFPVDILLRPDNSFGVLGEIHNLPLQGNEKLYQDLFCAFKGMLPGFRELGIFDSEKQQVVQVVVKAQKVFVREGKVFEENWHLEGGRDKVVAGGVYFVKFSRMLVASLWLLNRKNTRIRFIKKWVLWRRLACQ